MRAFGGASLLPDVFRLPDLLHSVVIRLQLGLPEQPGKHRFGRQPPRGAGCFVQRPNFILTRTTRLALSVAFAPLLLLGCAAVPPDDGQLPFDGGLAAGEDVTYDQYQAAFNEYRACLQGKGYEIVIHGEVNRTIQFSVPSAAVDSGADAECYDGGFALVDAAWQISQIDTSESAQILRACLIELGIEPDESYQAMNEQLFESGNDPTACVSQ